MAAIHGAEPSVERRAADRRISAYAFGVIQPSCECAQLVLKSGRHASSMKRA
jgi:hypothetical protein